MHSAALEFPYVLSEREEINSILYKPINSTQRIKYTCFNVSPSYIVLGSTSGSAYLFSREPCSFLQIIPLSEGVVSRVAISPDEKTIALATIRGTICLVSLKPTSRLTAISTEHIYEQITCLCWNDSSTEIYIGDVVGRVSVMVLSIFTVNGMFQTPTCTLMNLDSSVVQLNFFPPLLLVSTLARCYICDTVREQYKQIGSRARNGEFGACFYKAHTHENDVGDADVQREARNIDTRGAFNLISDNDGQTLDENHPKVFCARPGSRLWEVSADGMVVKTHQLKEALAVPPTTIFRSVPSPASSHDDEEEEEMEEEEEEGTEREWLPQSVNFSQLFTIAHKYLFSYSTGGLYVVDPANASVVLWSNECTNVSATAVVGDKIYLMTCDGEFRCLELSLLDALVLQLYRRENYRECLRACILYRKRLSRAIATTIAGEVVVELENLPRMPNDEETLELRLRPLITLLRACGNDRPAKLDSGIVVVHSENDKFAADKRSPCSPCETTTSASQSSPETFSEDSSEMQMLEPTKKDLDGNLAQGNAHETANSIEKATDSDRNADTLSVKNDDDNCRGKEEEDPLENVTHRVQSDLESIYATANSVRAGMSEREIEKVVLDMERKMRAVVESYRDSTPGLCGFVYEITRAAELHYHNVFLENTSVQLLRTTASEHVVRQFARAFVDVNASAYARCGCGYPCPMDRKVAATEPRFLAIGESLIGRLADDLPEECSNICNRVPFMWRVYLAARVERHNPLDDVLRQCLQTKDNVVLSFLLPALNEQQWGCVIACLGEIENGACLFCATPLARKLDHDVPIDWSGVAREIMGREGPDQAMAFLVKLQSSMPDVTLDRSIFQSIVFTKLLYHRGVKKSINFDENNRITSKFGTICSPQVRDQLAKALEKDLKRPIDQKLFGTDAHHWGMRHQARSLACPCCTLSLQTPILLGNNGVAIFRCGHAYHVNCMIERKLTRCNLHQ